MFKPTKWFGLSLALHLAVAITLVLLASRNIERKPKVIMVDLDNLATLDIQPHKISQTRVFKAARPAASARLVKPAKSEVTRQLFQSDVPRVPPINPVTKENRVRELLKVNPEAPVSAANHQRADDSNSALKPLSKTPMQFLAPAAEERLTPDKEQQRYLKEHVTYIRDLITTHLTYPPMARKMNWSGKVVVAFVVAEDGTVNNIRVVESSGYKTLDKSALETVRSVAPFPNPPLRAEIVVPINFRMMP